MVVILDRAAPRGGDRGDPRRRRAHAADHRTATSRGAAGGQRALAGRPAVGHRRHAGGRHLGRRDQVHRRRARRAAVAARRRASAQAAVDAGYDLGRSCTRTTSSTRRRLLLRRHRRHRRRRAPGRPLPGARDRDDRVARHALAHRHRAPDRAPPTIARSCAPTPGSATADDHGRFRLVDRAAARSLRTGPRPPRGRGHDCHARRQGCVRQPGGGRPAGPPGAGRADRRAARQHRRPHRHLRRRRRRAVAGRNARAAAAARGH